MPLASPLIAVVAGTDRELVPPSQPMLPPPPIAPPTEAALVVEADAFPAPLLSFTDAVDGVGDGEETGEDVDVRLERCGVVGWLLLEDGGF